MSTKVSENPCRAEFHWFFLLSPRWPVGHLKLFLKRFAFWRHLRCPWGYATEMRKDMPHGWACCCHPNSPLTSQLESHSCPFQALTDVLKIVATIFALYSAAVPALSQKIPAKGCRGKCYPHTYTSSRSSQSPRGVEWIFIDDGAKKLWRKSDREREKQRERERSGTESATL